MGETLLRRILVSPNTARGDRFAEKVSFQITLLYSLYPH
jgi:hypothetical protein